MKRPKGPELKMPEMSVSPFLADLFYDLRERRLLPLVALVVVAIAAVPFLLGSSEKPVPPAASVGAATPGGTDALDASALTVVQAKPGLREYRKRLAHRRPTDPFKQHYTAPNLKGATLPDVEASSSSGTTVTTTSSSGTTTTTSPSGGAPPSSSPPSGGGGKPHLVLFDYAIDARISYSPPPGAEGGQQEPFVEKRVLPQTSLPGEKAPVVTYMGPGRKEGDKATGKVLLIVSADVQEISGEHRCVSSSQTGGVCQLLEVEPGFPLTFAYGEAGAHYTIKVLSIRLVVTGHT